MQIGVGLYLFITLLFQIISTPLSALDAEIATTEVGALCRRGFTGVSRQSLLDPRQRGVDQEMERFSPNPENRKVNGIHAEGHHRMEGSRIPKLIKENKSPEELLATAQDIVFGGGSRDKMADLEAVWVHILENHAKDPARLSRLIEEFYRDTRTDLEGTRKKFLNRLAVLVADQMSGESAQAKALANALHTRLNTIEESPNTAPVAFGIPLIPLLGELAARGDARAKFRLMNLVHWLKPNSLDFRPGAADWANMDYLAKAEHWYNAVRQLERVVPHKRLELLEMFRESTWKIGEIPPMGLRYLWETGLINNPDVIRSFLEHGNHLPESTRAAIYRGIITQLTHDQRTQERRTAVLTALENPDVRKALQASTHLPRIMKFFGRAGELDTADMGILAKLKDKAPEFELFSTFNSDKIVDLMNGVLSEKYGSPPPIEIQNLVLNQLLLSTDPNALAHIKRFFKTFRNASHLDSTNVGLFEIASKEVQEQLQKETDSALKPTAGETPLDPQGLADLLNASAVVGHSKAGSIRRTYHRYIRPPRFEVQLDPNNPAKMYTLAELVEVMSKKEGASKTTVDLAVAYVNSGYAKTSDLEALAKKLKGTEAEKILRFKLFLMESGHPSFLVRFDKFTPERSRWEHELTRLKKNTVGDRTPLLSDGKIVVALSAIFAWGTGVTAKQLFNLYKEATSGDEDSEEEIIDLVVKQLGIEGTEEEREGIKKVLRERMAKEKKEMSHKK